jgi:rhodanese-related sulfurtransferase
MARKHSKSKHVSSETASQRRRKTHHRNLTLLWVGLGVLAVVVVGILLLNSGTIPSSGIVPTGTSTVEISPAQAYAKFQQGAFFLDVRSQEEWNQFHIAGSTLIPLDQLQNRLSELPKDKDIVVVCLSGHRSLSGTAILQQAGFTRISCLSGGLTAWKAAGYPLVGNAP